MTQRQLKQILETTERQQQPVVVLPLRQYESLIATLEELSDPQALAALKESEEDTRLGRLLSFEEVFGEPLYAKNRVNQKGRQGPRKT